MPSMLATGFVDPAPGRYACQMLVLLLFGPGAFVIAASLAALLRPTPARVFALVAAGPVLAGTWFIIAYLGAPTERPPGDTCSDCSITYGRWWEFGFFVMVLLFNVIAWWLGALVGAGARWAVQRSASTRPSAA